MRFILPVLFLFSIGFGCNCLCDDLQPTDYQLSFAFKNDSLDNVLPNYIGEYAYVYFYDENQQKSLIKSWKIDSLTAFWGQLDYSYNSPCEAYIQDFSIELDTFSIAGQLIVHPFYDPKSCCSEYCYRGYISEYRYQNIYKVDLGPSEDYIWFQAKI